PELSVTVSGSPTRAARRPARTRRLDPTRPDDRPQLGRPAHHPDRRAAWLPPADGAGAAATGSMPQAATGWARRRARTRPISAPHPDPAGPDHRPGPLHPARPPAAG